jgi:DNA-binding response OmpR family regulator
MARILIVEDDAPIAALLADHLMRAGHTVRVVDNGIKAITLYRTERAHLILLDLMLPGASGYEVCRAIRDEGGPQPIVLMLTARVNEDDAILGYAVGADDYIRKPFSVRELLARIQVLLRFERREPSVEEPDGDALTLGPLRLERETRQAKIGTQFLYLTPMEFDMLFFLASRTGEVLTRETILSEIWGYTDAAHSKTVDSHVSRLRRKLTAAGFAKEIIGTVHGIGYVLSIDALENAM